MELNVLLQTILYAVIITVVPILTGHAISLLAKLKDFLFSRFTQIEDSKVVNEVLDLISSVVASTSQTYVDALKKEGRFDEDAHREAFFITKNTVTKLISDEYKEILSALYSDVDTWLDTQIEASVRNQKKKLEKLDIIVEEGE